MAIFVTGDIHGPKDVTRLSDVFFPKGQKLTKKDFVIVLGDFGLVWYWEQSKRELYWLEWLSSLPFTTLFLDGNHENFYRLLKYPKKSFKGGKASQIHDTVFYLRRGEVFTIDGKMIFVMGGAMSTDKEDRIEGESWWPQEEPNYKDWDNAAKNLARHGNKIDIVLTHTAPQSIAKRMSRYSHCYIESARIEDPVAIALERVKKGIKFKYWCYGHLHCNWTSGKFTSLYDNIKKLK